MANSVDPDQTAPIEAVCSGSTLFASILNSSVMLGNFHSRRLQQTTFSDAFFLGALRVKPLCLSDCLQTLSKISVASKILVDIVIWRLSLYDIKNLKLHLYFVF